MTTSPVQYVVHCLFANYLLAPSQAFRWEAKCRILFQLCSNVLPPPTVVPEQQCLMSFSCSRQLGKCSFRMMVVLCHANSLCHTSFSLMSSSKSVIQSKMLWWWHWQHTAPSRKGKSLVSSSLQGPATGVFHKRWSKSQRSKKALVMTLTAYSANKANFAMPARLMFPMSKLKTLASYTIPSFCPSWHQKEEWSHKWPSCNFWNLYTTLVCALAAMFSKVAASWRVWAWPSNIMVVLICEWSICTCR